ncbi:MAG TPA: hypothetical protein VH186_12295 [Chloroflexia bacterium]|nr:hypothetical protein [Chloroflexia bacterium]
MASGNPYFGISLASFIDDQDGKRIELCWIALQSSGFCEEKVQPIIDLERHSLRPRQPEPDSSGYPGYYPYLNGGSSQHG